MQQMTINRKSWHYRLNVWFFGKWHVESLSNGCPYFWGTILAMVLTPLKLLVDGLNRASEKMPKLPEFPQINFPHIDMPQISDETSEKIGVGVIIVILATIGGVTAYEVIIGNWIPVAIVYGILGALTGLIIGASKLVEYIDERRRRSPPKPKVQRGPNPVVQMIKAKKNKYCPKLVLTD